LERDLESIFRAGMLKILLQQYLPKGDMLRFPGHIHFTGNNEAKRTCVGQTRLLPAKEKNSGGLHAALRISIFRVRLNGLYLQ